MANYLSNHINTPTPQSQQAEPNQIQNNAGAFAFQISPMQRLERFLILGTEGGTYYVGETDLTKQNLDNLRTLVANDPKAVVNKIVEVSHSGRAYRNDAAIFALAYVMTHANEEGKFYARTNFNSVVRTATHLFQAEGFLKALASGSGLGTSRNKAIANWYVSKDADELAYQVIKYRQRYGWTHKDSMRQARPKGVNTDLGNWILGKASNSDNLPEIVHGFEAAQKAKTTGEILSVLNDYPKLPWEALPTQFHKEAEVWRTIFNNGQLKGQALVRNITRLARLGILNDMVFARDYANKLIDEEMIRRTRLHPIQYVNALVVYTEGQMDRVRGIGYGWGPRKKDWTTSSIIVDALNEGVHRSFKHLEPTGKRTLLALDVSGSMSSAFGMGLDLSAAQISGVMATAIARTEPYHQIMGFATQFKDLGISAQMDLKTVMHKVANQNFGGTDCALPMTWAKQHKVAIDTFVVITDNETWAGRVHPYQALRDYRKAMGIDAKLAVVGVTSTDISIADPNDGGMLDLVGADSNLPKILADFSAGRI